MAYDFIEITTVPVGGIVRLCTMCDKTVLDKVVKFQCDHSFHQNCTGKLTGCPVCNAKFVGDVKRLVQVARCM